MKEPLQSEIASADPIAGDHDAQLRGVMHSMSVRARATSMANARAQLPWWKRRRNVLPLAFVGVAALTGGAVLVPLGLWINSDRVDLDAEIPIRYRTDSGIDVSCRYGIYFGEPASRTEADERLSQFVKSHDWTGVGQRIYERAIANPFVPGPDDDWEVDTQEVRDSFAFSDALSVVIWEEIPAALTQGSISSAGTSDCRGTLR